VPKVFKDLKVIQARLVQLALPALRVFKVTLALPVLLAQLQLLLVLPVLLVLLALPVRVSHIKVA
jgi:hypothetical protein